MLQYPLSPEIFRIIIEFFSYEYLHVQHEYCFEQYLVLEEYNTRWMEASAYLTSVELWNNCLLLKNWCTRSLSLSLYRNSRLVRIRYYSVYQQYYLDEKDKRESIIEVFSCPFCFTHILSFSLSLSLLTSFINYVMTFFLLLTVVRKNKEKNIVWVSNSIKSPITWKIRMISN